VQKYGLGDNQILVELPGISDMDKVKDIIRDTARALRFIPWSATMASPPSRKPWPASAVRCLPRMHWCMEAAPWGQFRRRPDLCVATRGGCGRKRFPLREPSTNSNTGQREVQFTLTNDAGEKFYDYTKANVGNYMAVVMGNSVREVAVIKNPIHVPARSKARSARTKCSGSPSCLKPAHCRRRSNILRIVRWARRSPPTPFAPRVTAAVAGIAVVMIFMLILLSRRGHQRRPGLFLNLLILLGVMGLSSVLAQSAGNGGMTFTLTLPGIAGVILTIGMAVDSTC